MRHSRRYPPPCTVPDPWRCLTRPRLYAAGWLCDQHSPWGRLGLSRPVAGPGWPATAWTTPVGQGVASLIDERAIATGRRRARPEDYRAAQAATNHRKDT